MDNQQSSHLLVLMGGTFDPVHNGHMALAKKLYTIFGQKVTFVPTASPNYKIPPQTTPEQRLDMLKLSLGNNTCFNLDTSEIFSKKYIPTVESLTTLRKNLGFNIPIYFLIGEDSLITLDTWDNWRKLFNLTNFVVAMRPGYNLRKMSYELADEYKKRVICQRSELTLPYGQIYKLDFTPIDISSTKIRANTAANLPINNMVDPAVAKYIIDNKLYLNSNFC